jgi:hypothetical protein
VLPLLHWVLEVCASTKFEGPPLRACFILDDPNLHWPHYGFVDFKEIAMTAARENYHVCFATIPLDTWFTHRGTAKLFRDQTKQLSLCVHGNNHTKAELAGNLSEGQRRSLLSQAIQRIERLERGAGLRVCRVMVPPHGACSEEMLADLPNCGFESACISHGSLRAHNKAKPWTKSLGVFPSEVIQGCPVLPRWGLAGATTNAILLAAFLKQPFVLRGHHQDLKDGVEVLDKLGGFINGLGPVSWSNMTGLTRTNYQWKMEGNMCRLRPLSRKVTFEVPKQATRLIIESARDACWEKWQVSSAEGLTQEVRAGEPVAMPATLNGVVSIETAPAPAMPVEHLSHRSTTAALFRRLFTEGRDRLRFA